MLTTFLSRSANVLSTLINNFSSQEILSSLFSKGAKDTKSNLVPPISTEKGVAASIGISILKLLLSNSLRDVGKEASPFVNSPVPLKTFCSSSVGRQLG